MLVASGKSHEYAPTGPTDRQSYSQILVLVRFNRQTDRQTDRCNITTVALYVLLCHRLIFGTQCFP